LGGNDRVAADGARLLSAAAFGEREVAGYLAAIAGDSDDAIYGSDPSGRIRMWNRGSSALFGYQPHEIIGQPAAQLVARGRVADESLWFERALRGERIAPVETERIDKDGEVVEVSLTISPIHGPEGVVGVAWTARDVGWTMQARRRAEVSAAVSHALADANLGEHDMLALVAREIGDAMRGGCLISLLDENGGPATNVFHHADPEAGATALGDGASDVGEPAPWLVAEVLRGGSARRLDASHAAELTELSTDRHWPYLERHPLCAALVAPIRHERRVLGVMVLGRSMPGGPFTANDERFVVDLGERVGLALTNARLYRAAHDELAHRRDAEASLRASEERFRRLAENAPVVIYRFRMTDGCVEYISPAVVDLLGFEPEDVYADSQLVLSGADPRDVQITIDYYKDLENQTLPLVSRRRHRDGRDVWIETRAVYLRDEDGQPIAIEGITTDITAMKEAEAELIRHATHDDLTGLANRTLFLEHVDGALARSTTERRSIAVLFLDLDRFKVINDSLGHAVGDHVLCEAASRLRNAVGTGDVVARLGGDEFAVLVDRSTDVEDVTDVVLQILDVFRRPFTAQDQVVHSTVSIGVAYLATRADQASDLLRHADAALYVAKEHGRDRAEVFDDRLRLRLHERLRTETELRLAVGAGEFELHYQPIFRLPGRELLGVEALVRWNHPVRGLVAASDFIELAEECGLIVELGRWVFEQACRQSDRWCRNGVRLNMAVNLSAAQLVDPAETERLATTLAESGADPSLLCLEITETALMPDVKRSLRRLERLKGLGLRLAIDDFGTGYSSLTYLQRFPIDAVKIDKSFVDGLATDRQDTQIVEAIVSLAGALRLTTVAEGVETDQQLDALVALGCDAAQGYLLGRPMTVEQIDGLATPHAPRP
jgi:diguanylate cyclase (GGDEF)-like protein/PAS domain S-box-containing protein